MALNRAGQNGALQAMLVPIAGSSDFKAVATTETDFDTTMAAGETYVFTCDTDCYIKQGTAPIAASAADGSMFVPAGMPVLIDGGQGPNLSVIRKSADGVATLQKLAVLV
jgi:hypothetical protein